MNKLYGNDIINKFLSKGLTEDFCIVPFTTLQLEANGNVNMCRQKGTEFSIGNIKNKSIKEIWNDDPIKNIRREFLEGNIKTCSDDIKHNKCNLCVENNEIFESVDLSIIQHGPVQRLGFNINGKCNLQCQMCHVWKMPNDLYNEENFWGYARESIFPFLKEVELLSGEPFLQKDTYKLIDELSVINPDCKWIITTNSHWKLSSTIKKKLDKIRIRNLIVSIDSLVPETYSKIRKLGKLKVVLENVENLLEYEKERVDNSLSSLDIRVNYLIQKDNWKEVKNIFSYHDKNPKLTQFITFLYEPSEFSLLTHSVEKRKEILDWYLENLNPREVALVMRVIKPVLSSLDKKAQVEYYIKLKSFLE